MKKKAGIAGILVAIVAAILVAVSEAGVRLATRTNPETGMLVMGRVALLPYRPVRDAAQASWESAGTSSYLVRDQDLGWAIRGNGESGDYTATVDGFRGPKGQATTRSPSAGKARVAVYGDSFTHGDGVALKDTWADQFERSRANLEVLNFGVPAYGTDQAFLRFRRDGRKFISSIHILGIWPENLVRNVNVVRFYLNPQGVLGNSKPRFVLAGGKLALVNSPVMSREAFLDTVLQNSVSPLMVHDFWYREDEQRFPTYFHLQSLRAMASVYTAYERRQTRSRLYFDRDGEPLKVTVAIAEAFQREVAEAGSRGYVSIIPMRDLLDAHASGAFPLPEMLKARSISVLDFGPVVAAKAREVGADTLYLPDGHLSALGNRLIADELGRRLSQELDALAK